MRKPSKVVDDNLGEYNIPKMITRVTEKCRCNGQTCQCAFLGFCMNTNLPQYTAWGTQTCTHIPVLVQTKSKQVTLHENYMPFCSHRNSVCQMFIRMNVYVWNLTAARYQTHFGHNRSPRDVFCSSGQHGHSSELDISSSSATACSYLKVRYHCLRGASQTFC